jgi:signal transduction histidine kinase
MSPISVSVSLTGEVVTLDVKDSGPGIPSADRERIFEPYRRADTSRTVETSVGLGLALSRRLARLMNGTLTYVDGSGTIFRLSLPRPSDEDT